jgi:hypothetical protein
MIYLNAQFQPILILAIQNMGHNHNEQTDSNESISDLYLPMTSQQYFAHH